MVNVASISVSVLSQHEGNYQAVMVSWRVTAPNNARYGDWFKLVMYCVCLDMSTLQLNLPLQTSFKNIFRDDKEQLINT